MSNGPVRGVHGHNLVGGNPVRLCLPRHVRDTQILRLDSHSPLETLAFRGRDRTENHRAEVRTVQSIGGDDETGAHPLLLATFLGIQIDHPDLAAHGLRRAHPAPLRLRLAFAGVSSASPAANAPSSSSRSARSDSVTSAAALLNTSSRFSSRSRAISRSIRPRRKSALFDRPPARRSRHASVSRKTRTLI